MPSKNSERESAFVTVVELVDGTERATKTREAIAQNDKKIVGKRAKDVLEAIEAVVEHFRVYNEIKNIFLTFPQAGYEMLREVLNEKGIAISSAVALASMSASSKEIPFVTEDSMEEAYIEHFHIKLEEVKRKINQRIEDARNLWVQFKLNLSSAKDSYRGALYLKNAKKNSTPVKIGLYQKAGVFGAMADADIYDAMFYDHAPVAVIEKVERLLAQDDRWENSTVGEVLTAIVSAKDVASLFIKPSSDVPEVTSDKQLEVFTADMERIITQNEQTTRLLEVALEAVFFLNFEYEQNHDVGSF